MAYSKKKKTDDILEQDDAMESQAAPQDDSQTASEEVSPGESNDIAGELPAASEGAVLQLHSRLEKAVRAIAAHGGQDKVHALNRLELLTGSLKLAIPAAITAADDESLKADLGNLLGML